MLKTYTFDDIAKLSLQGFDAMAHEHQAVQLAVALTTLLAVIEAQESLGCPVPPCLTALVPELRKNLLAATRVLSEVGVVVEAVH